MFDANILTQWVNAAFNENRFLYVLGGIFILGVLVKSIVVANYRKLIKGAENANQSESAVLRQIKMRIDSVREVQGIIVEPEALVERQLNRCKILKLSINTMDSLIHWCAVLILVWSVAGLIVNRSAINMFIGIGIALVLEAIDYSFDTDRLRKEFQTIMIDYIVNNGVEKKRELEETLSETNLEDTDSEMKEIILNQVIGEFLQ